jgi:hypothetical protein
MESDKGKAAQEKIKVGTKEARSVASSISKSAKSALEDLAPTGPKGTRSANNTIASYPTEIEAIMGFCFDSQSADNMSPHKLSEAIIHSIEKSRQGTSLLGGNMMATPGMISSVLKPVLDYTETTSPSNPIPVPCKTMTKEDINAHGENKKSASKIPLYDMVTPLITETIMEMTGINFGKMIDDAYIVGGGIDINSHSLWNYRTLHALCVKKHLAKLAYKCWRYYNLRGFIFSLIPSERIHTLG